MKQCDKVKIRKLLKKIHRMDYIIKCDICGEYNDLDIHIPRCENCGSKICDVCAKNKKQFVVSQYQVASDKREIYVDECVKCTSQIKKRKFNDSELLQIAFKKLKTDRKSFKKIIKKDYYWNLQKLIWVSFEKNGIFSKLPKEIVRYIIGFLIYEPKAIIYKNYETFDDYQDRPSGDIDNILKFS